MHWDHEPLGLGALASLPARRLGEEHAGKDASAPRRVHEKAPFGLGLGAALLELICALPMLADAGESMRGEMTSSPGTSPPVPKAFGVQEERERISQTRSEDWPRSLAAMPLRTRITELNRTNCVEVMLGAFQSNQLVKALIFMPGATDEFYMFRRAKSAVRESRPIAARCGGRAHKPDVDPGHISRSAVGAAHR